MGLNKKDELFCEVGVSLGYLTKDQISRTIEQIAANETTEVQKSIGDYFLNESILSKEQIDEIIVETTHRENTSLQASTKLEETTNSNISDFTLEEGESIEEKYCPNCNSNVPVKVTKRSKDYLGCGCGCFGIMVNLILLFLSFGHWATVWGAIAFGMWLFTPEPNDLIVCLKQTFRVHSRVFQNKT